MNITKAKNLTEQVKEQINEGYFLIPEVLLDNVNAKLDNLAKNLQSDNLLLNLLIRIEELGWKTRTNSFGFPATSYERTTKGTQFILSIHGIDKLVLYSCDHGEPTLVTIQKLSTFSHSELLETMCLFKVFKEEERGKYEEIVKRVKSLMNLE